MENLNKRPSKGILRFSACSSRSNSVEKDIKWDEDNIKETLHPEDKDYGYMKIDEPPTPYSRSPHGHDGENSDDDDEANLTRTSELLERVSKKIKEPPVSIEDVENLLDEEDLNAIEREESSSNNNGPEPNTWSPSTSSKVYPSPSEGTSGNQKLSDFEKHRKRHYNEFHAVKLAKKLMQKELDNDDDDDVDQKNTNDEQLSDKRAKSDSANDR